ncbi:hypothetical protein C8J57DRAFT_1233702 [Mycena rebaudengoi]|nr:hypothetical protein C8J57DRAFT_1233702 [Mycena rebaudengoi]
MAGSPTSVPSTMTPPGTTLNCGTWYFVEKGVFVRIYFGKASTVAGNTGILHQDDFVTLNPELNPECTNLWAEYWYCVAAFPPLGAGPTSTIPEGTGFFSMMTVSLPSQTSTAPFDFPIGYLAPPPNLASGSITTGCDWYYTVVSGDTCATVEELRQVSESDFKAWNFNPCPKLTPGSAGCARWYTIVRGDGCAKLEMTFNLTQSELFALNPELTRTFCTGFGTASGPPSDLNPGSWNNCTSYYSPFPSATSCTGTLKFLQPAVDSCGAIETETSVSDAVLRSLNPWLDSIYKWDKTCPPANLNPGSWSRFSVPFCDFLHWNPEVSTTCSNLNLAPITRALKSYCVGISGGCESLYTVVSQDSCGKIEAKTSVSDALLRALNPWLDSSCNTSS